MHIIKDRRQRKGALRLRQKATFLLVHCGAGEAGGAHMNPTDH